MSLESHTASPRVLARGLSLTYPGGTRALDGVDLALQPGELVAVVGPSGCGKSTLLRLLCGLQEGFEGELTVSDRAPAQARRQGNPASFVFQQPTLLPWRSVIQNVLLPLELEKRLDSNAQHLAMGLLERVGLQDFQQAYPHQLSGGMQMRVSVARALITRPELLLLDEPFAALDELTRQDLCELLLQVWSQTKVTTVFVTPNMFEAVFLASRILVMSGRPGRILAEIPVPFAYPRAPELRGSAEFASVVGEVSRCLRLSRV